MDGYSTKFVEDYKAATEKEFEIFLAKSNIHACKKKGFPESSLKDCVDSLQELETSFMADRRKLAGYQLSPQQAISIVSQAAKQDNHTLDINAIDGADCYRFMNKGIQSNALVAHAAWKQDSKVERHFPTSLKEQMEGHKPEKVFGAMDSGATLERSVDALNTVRDLTAGMAARSAQTKSRGLSFA